jgi:phosphoribosylformylglycinamidine synthase
MVGLLERIDRRVPSHFQKSGDRIVLLGESVAGPLGGSAYWTYICDFIGGEQPPVDLEKELALQKLLVEAAKRKLLRSAHDCSAGGLAVTLAEAAMGGPYATEGMGAEVRLEAEGAAARVPATSAAPPDAAVLYSEAHARAVVSCDPANEKALLALATEFGVPAAAAGTVGTPRGELVITTASGKYAWPIERLRTVYFSAIPRRMSHVDEDRAEA